MLKREGVGLILIILPPVRVSAQDRLERKFLFSGTCIFAQIHI